MGASADSDHRFHLRHILFEVIKAIAESLAEVKPKPVA